MNKLELLRSTAETRLRNCREIPDLWYYRARISERLKDAKDATYSLNQAKELGSEAERGGIDPFAPVVAKIHVAFIQDHPRKMGAGGWHRPISGLEEHSPRWVTQSTMRRLLPLCWPMKTAGRFKKENIIQLVDEQATLLGIRTAIGQIREKSKPDDLVVLYMASHGSPRSSDPNGVSYVITNDTRNG